MISLMKDRLAGLCLQWNWTCCAPDQEPTFRALLDRLQPKTVLEIGTHQGVSTALLAEYSERVVTVDVLPNPARAVVWDRLGVSDRIEAHVHKSQAGRDAEITKAAAVADLAFIDGSHLARDIEHDFQLVASVGCKRIILHDYWKNAEDWPDVKSFADALSAFGSCVIGNIGNQVRKEVCVGIYKPFVLVEVAP